MPQRLYSLDELKLNGIDTSSFLSPVDVTLGSIERNLQFAAIAGGVSVWFAFGISPAQTLYISLGLLFLWSLDSVSELVSPTSIENLYVFLVLSFCLCKKLMGFEGIVA